MIPYVDSCIHLGDKISMNRLNVFINNATNDLHCGLHSLLADFFHCDSVTLSTLFKIKIMIEKFYFRSLRPIERTCKHSDKIEYKMVHDI